MALALMPGVHGGTFASDVLGPPPEGVGAYGANGSAPRSTEDIWRGVEADGYISLTDPWPSAWGSVVLPPLDTTPVKAFEFAAEVRVGGGSGDNAADGFSISFARLGDPAGAGLLDFCPMDGPYNAEEGTKTGLAIGFDTWAGNGTPDGRPEAADIIAISVRMDSVLIAQHSMVADNGTTDLPGNLLTGPRNPSWDGTLETVAESWVNLTWQPVRIRLNEGGTLDVWYKGAQVFAGLQTGFMPYEGQFVMAARTGAANANHHLDNLQVHTTPLDSDPPVITSATASPDVLWPPNHQMVPVKIAVAAHDVSGIAAVRIISVSSNEPENGLGDGDTRPDWVLTGDLSLQLRSERSGGGSGRVYTVTVQCTDNAGNSSTVDVLVNVPTNMGKRR